MYDTKSETCMRSFAAHFGKIGGVCLWESQQQLISCGYDGEILVHSSTNLDCRENIDKDEWSDTG